MHPTNHYTVIFLILGSPVPLGLAAFLILLDTLLKLFWMFPFCCLVQVITQLPDRAYI